MKIVIRVDASIWIGNGHVMRCLVLAEELRKRHQVVFVCLAQRGDSIELIRHRGFEVKELSLLEKAVTPNNDSDYLGWLQRPVEVDARDFLGVLDEADLVITDHYAIGEDWQRKVRKALGCYVVAIDDLTRKHDADLIVDQTLGRKVDEYDSEGEVLAGTKYAILNPLFFSYRVKALQQTFEPSYPRIFVSMGGVDLPGATLAVLEQLASYPNIAITVLLGSKSPYYSHVSSFCSEHQNILHLGFVENMAELMFEHDIAIGAPGTTSWERACLGIPSIIIPLAPNQNEIASQLECLGVAFKVELSQIEAHLKSALDMLLVKGQSLRNLSFKQCDGLGVFRVTMEIDSLLSGGRSYRLINASNSDIKLVYEWQCCPETRKYALNPQVPTWDGHVTWMTEKLLSNEDFFYLVEDIKSKKKLGVLRLDHIEQNEYLVSIFIDREHYGKGIALCALEEASSVHPMLTLHADVLADNYASQRLFEKAGYKRLSAEKFIRKAVL